MLAGDAVGGAHLLDDALAAGVEVVANLLGGADGVGHWAVSGWGWASDACSAAPVWV